MNRNLLKKQKSVRYNNHTRRHIFNYPGVYQLLIVACIGADFLTLFSLIDVFLKQSQTMSYIITFAVAGVLNIAAVLLAACLHNEEFTPRVKKMLAGLILTVFTLFFSAVFTLRVVSMEQMYGSNSNELGIDIADNTTVLPGYSEEEDTFHPTLGQIILAVILGLEPLGTSVLCFYIGYEQSPKHKRRYLTEQHIIELEEAIDNDTVMFNELKADIEFDLDGHDQIQYEEFRARIIQLGKISKNDARRILSEHDGSPEGVSYLMEGGYHEHAKEKTEFEDSNVTSSIKDEITT